MYICALVSLVLLCSASWFIISLETHPISNVDAEMDAYKIMDADTSGSFNVSQDVIYNGKTYTLDQIKSEIVAAKKTELYGNGAVDISINWKLGYYFTKDDKGKEIEITDPDEIGKVAGTHYCEIIDNVTGQVIEPKHEVVIGQDTLTVNAELKNTSPLFVGKTVTYSAVWTGNTSGTPYDILNDATYTVQEGDFTGNAQLCENVSTPGVKLSDLVSDFLFKNNYNVAGAPAATVEYDILANCYSIADDNVTLYYGSLNQGLAETNTANKSGTTLVALQSFTYPTSTTVYTSGTHYNHTISGGVKTVGSNVTLIIPYDADMAYYDTSTQVYTPKLVYQIAEKTPYSKSAYDTPGYLKNYVTVSDKLDNKGTIIIPGIVTGGNGGSLASVTADAHSRIKLGSGAIINNSGNITCHGYIEEETYKNGSQLITTGGDIQVVFSFVEHRGGGTFLAMLSGGGMKNMSPFNRFFVETITTELVVKEGASVYGFYDVQMDKKHLDGTLGLFGTGSNYFIGFDANDGKETQVYLRYDTREDQNQMTIKGSAFINKISISVEYNYIPITLSTEFIYLPISHYWKIQCSKFNSELGYTDSSAKIDASSQDLKIMPGASMTIDTGVSFTGRNVAVYDVSVPIPSNQTATYFEYYSKANEDAANTFDSNHGLVDGVYNPNSGKTPPSTYKDGELIVNGSLEVDYLGGRVIAETAGATLKITDGISVVPVELAKAEKGLLSYSVSYTKDTAPTTLKAKNDVLYNNTVEGDEELKTVRTYTSFKKGSSYVWYYDIEITIKYNLIGGTLEGSTGANGVVTKTFNANSKDGLTLGASHLTKPTRAYYVFGDDWYTDSGFNTAASGQTTYTDTTYNLYAPWTAIEYTVNVKHVYPDGTSLTEKGKYTFKHSGGAISLPTDLTHGTYDFNGWFKAEDFTSADNEIKSITEALFDSTGATREITIFVCWTKAADNKNLIFNYNTGDKNFGNHDMSETSKSYAPGTVVELGTSHDVNTDIDVQYYLAGWIDANGDPITSVTIGDADVTVYAVWKEKVKLTWDTTGVPSQLGVAAPSTVWLIAGEYDISVINEAFKTQIAKLWNANGYEINGTSIIEKVTVYFDNTWKLTDGSVGTISGTKLTIPAGEEGTATIQVVWKNKAKVTINVGSKAGLSGSNFNASFTLSVTAGGTTKTYSGSSTTTYYITPGDSFKFTISSYNNIIDSVSPDTWTPQASTTAVANITYSCKIYSYTCLVEGTLITLADGTQKRIEDITADDMLLVFNHETGKFEARHITYVDHMGEAASNCRVLNLVFSDGTVLRIVGTHGVYDMTLNKYVYISEYNVSDFLGHIFYTAEYDGEKFVGGKLELVDAYVTEEFVRVYSPITVYEANCFANNLLTVTPLMDGVESLIDIFDFDENMIFDMDKKQAEVAENGLYTYEDFAEYYSREEFDYLISFIERESQFFKISLAKGRVEKEDIIKLFNFVLRS